MILIKLFSLWLLIHFYSNFYCASNSNNLRFLVLLIKNKGNAGVDWDCIFYSAVGIRLLYSDSHLAYELWCYQMKRDNQE